MKTQEINTLSLAPTDFDAFVEEDNKMMLFEYLEGLRFMYRAQMTHHVTTGDTDYYVKAQKTKKRIKAIINRE